MFSKNNKLDKFKEAETIIGSSVKVKGNFQGRGDIIIEGFLDGSIKTAASIFIGDKAKISANIEAKDVIVNGEVHGNIKSKNYLALGGTAKIFGDLQYGEISIEKGAIVNGQLLMLSAEQKQIEKTKNIKKEETKEDSSKK
jgi:cytoskeletal protein CcmA (bactofilin family)